MQTWAFITYTLYMCVINTTHYIYYICAFITYTLYMCTFINYTPCKLRYFSKIPELETCSNLIIIKSIVLRIILHEFLYNTTLKRHNTIYWFFLTSEGKEPIISVVCW